MRSSLRTILGLLLPSLVHAATLAPGRDHTLVAAADGTLWAWGSNASGELGNGKQVPSLTPIAVLGLKDVVAVAAGTGFSAAADRDGRLFTWGANQSGQLGDGTTRGRLAPKVVDGLCGVASLATAEASLAVLCRDGTVETWGNNAYGQLGDGTTKMRSTPAPVHDETGEGVLQGIVSIVAGYRFFAALAKDGSVWAWGENDIAELGQGAPGDQRPLPVHVRDALGRGVLTGITAISAGLGHFTLALDNEGTLWGWGANKHGQLGIGTVQNPLPVPIHVRDASGRHELRKVTAIAAGSWHSLALCADGTLWGFGMNVRGEVGDGTNTARGLPVPVLASQHHLFRARIVEIAGGPYRSLALEADGTLWAWGWNATGQVGDGSMSDRYFPTRARLGERMPPAGTP